MTKINFVRLIFTISLSVLMFSTARAQDNSQPEDVKPNQVRPFRLIQELGLTPEQIQQIRRINQTRRPIQQAAQMRWREANEALDAAIYAEETNEEQIKALTKAAQIAQSELLKERTITEYLIRKVLTPEQLVKFRELRSRVRDRLNQRKSLKKQENDGDRTPRRFNRFQRRNQDRPQ